MSSERDDVEVTLDYDRAVAIVSLPGIDPIDLPLAWFKSKAKVGNDGAADLTFRLRVDELHVVPAAPSVVELNDVPELITPQEAFEAQFRRAAGHR